MFTKCQGSGGYTSGTRGGWLMPFSGVSVCFQNQLTASVQCRFSWSSIEVVRLRSELLETWRLLAAHTTTLNRDIYNRHCAINCVCVCVSANSTWKPRHHRGVDPLDTRLDGQLVPPIRRQLVSLSSGFVGWTSGRRGTVVADQRRGGEPRPTPDQSEPGTVVLLCSAFRSYFCFSFSFIRFLKKKLTGFSSLCPCQIDKSNSGHTRNRCSRTGEDKLMFFFLALHSDNPDFLFPATVFGSTGPGSRHCL